MTFRMTFKGATAVPAKEGPAPFRKVGSVSTLSVGVTEIVGADAVVHVNAAGTAFTPGWTDLTLAPRVYLTPPADGVQEFDFIGREPGGFVPQVTAKVEAEGFVTLAPWMTGLRVIAETNAITAILPYTGTGPLLERGETGEDSREVCETFNAEFDLLFGTTLSVNATVCFPEGLNVMEDVRHCAEKAFTAAIATYLRTLSIEATKVTAVAVFGACMVERLGKTLADQVSVEFYVTLD